MKTAGSSWRTSGIRSRLRLCLIFQGASLSDCISMLHYGYATDTGDALADQLMTRGGMDSMLWTINIALNAIGFGGIYSRIGAVESLLGRTDQERTYAVPDGTDHYPHGHVLYRYHVRPVSGTHRTGFHVYKERFDNLGLARNMLSRAQEDGGTLWSPLVPWSSCGAYHSSMLGVETLSYFPFCFVNLLNPIVSICTAAWGGNMIYADGYHTGFFGGKLRKGSVPAAPAEAHEVAMKRDWPS